MLVTTTQRPLLDRSDGDAPLSKQFIPSGPPRKDPNHLLPGLGLQDQIGPVGVVQQLHEGWGRRRIHNG